MWAHLVLPQFMVNNIVLILKNVETNLEEFGKLLKITQLLNGCTKIQIHGYWQPKCTKLQSRKPLLQYTSQFSWFLLFLSSSTCLLSQSPNLYL